MKMFLGGHAQDPLAWAAFSTELFSKIIDISNSVHKLARANHKILSYHFHFCSYTPVTLMFDTLSG